MESVPAASDAILNVALPPLSVPVPSVVAPFLNVTVPVGVPAPDETVAVKVTAVPYVDGFRDEATAVEEFALTMKLTDSVLSTLPATSVLWNVTVWLPGAATVNGPT